MRYVYARYQTQQRELAYRIYVTDALRLGYSLDKRYYNIINGIEDENDDVSENDIEENSRNVEKLLNKFRD